MWCALSLGGVGLVFMYRKGTPEDWKRIVELFLDWHTTIFNPAATMAIVLSLLPQVYETFWYRSRGSLSLSSLFSQSIVFMALAFSWKKRMFVPDDDLPEDPHSRITAWFNGGGWAVVDSALFSVVQGIVLLLAVFAICIGPHRREKAKPKAKPKPKPKPKPQPKVKAKAKGKSKAVSPERSPLLPQFVHLGSHGTSSK
jgi:hypothetical protein